MSYKISEMLCKWFKVCFRIDSFFPSDQIYFDHLGQFSLAKMGGLTSPSNNSYFVF